MIHEGYPQLAIGERTLVRSALVENLTLSQLAAAFKMPDRILAAAEQAFILRNNTNVQASIFRAYLAAVHEEAGQAELHQFVRGVFNSLLPPVVQACRSLDRTSDSKDELIAATKCKKEPTAETNYVGALQEWKSEKGVCGRFVEYDKRQTGPDHCPKWIVTCTVRIPDYGPNLSREFEGSASTAAKAKNACAPFPRASTAGASLAHLFISDSAAQAACQSLELDVA